MIFKASNAELEIIHKKLKAAVSEKIPLPVMTSYKIVKNGMAIEQALMPYRIVRDKLIEKYSLNGFVSERAEPDLYNKLCKELEPASNELVEVDISTIWLEDISNEKLPIDFISAISFMIED